jgi:hypothetical protein
VTCRCLQLIGSVIFLGLVMCMRRSRLIKSKVIGEEWLWRSSIYIRGWTTKDSTKMSP